MKQFHRMMLRMLPGPFLGWLAVLLFLLVMQFLIKYLPDLVGKGLPFLVIIELIIYNLAYMVVLAVPMAALIASLFTFRRLAESKAYAIMKGAGASFLQLSWPLIVLGILLTGSMWYFNTVIHPEANFRARNLWQDIRMAKPGFDLKPGEFYDGIENYRILVRDVPEDDPNDLREVVIYDYSDGSRFRTDITANSGRLFPVDEGRVLEFVLFDGEIHRRRPPGSGNKNRYEVLRFDRHVLRLSLEDLTFTRTDPTEGRHTERTMNSRDMIAMVDSLETLARMHKEILRARISELGTGSIAGAVLGRAISDPVRKAARASGLDPLDPGETVNIREGALRTARSLRADVNNRRGTIEYAEERANRFRVEIHKKWSIAIACLIFLMIGAPLGLVIRRGGLGLAAAVALAIFMFYWVSLVNGEKLADRGLLEPWVGMWIANIITGLFALSLMIYETLDLRAGTSIRRKLNTTVARILKARQSSRKTSAAHE